MKVSSSFDSIVKPHLVAHHRTHTQLPLFTIKNGAYTGTKKVHGQETEDPPDHSRDLRKNIS